MSQCPSFHSAAYLLVVSLLFPTVPFQQPLAFDWNRQAMLNFFNEDWFRVYRERDAQLPQHSHPDGFLAHVFWADRTCRGRKREADSSRQ